MNKDLKLKICGMRDADNIRKVAEFRPDYMGFIFYRESPRYVGPDFELFGLPREIKRVGVFVNATNEEMLKQAEKHHLTHIQLHGNETPEQVRELAGSGIRLWKVFSLHDQFDFDSVEAYMPYVDLFLFDTKGKYFGGNAQTFDWTVLQKYNQRIPFMLSGGLNTANIRDVRNLGGMNLHGLDFNSGVEATPGIKDPEKLQQAISEVRNLISQS